MTDRQLLDGSPVPEDGSHREIDSSTGMQKSYVVLTPEERSKGFVKPLRQKYLHSCGMVTTMGIALAETYARDPCFYSGTFCVGCREHRPLSEFTWEPGGEPMDPDLQEAWSKERLREASEKALASLDKDCVSRMAADKQADIDLAVAMTTAPDADPPLRTAARLPPTK